jgi:predicted MPP superfamily phosphohydrolase/TRAP-type C4-dicarboxylate transport system permease small subunit
MRGPRPFRIFLMVILALTPLAQSFWFVRAWRVIEAVAWPGPRALLQGLWVAAAGLVLAAGLDLLVGPVIPRRALRPWGRAGARLWLIASCLGFLAVAAVGSLEWLSQPATAALPAVQRAHVEPARRLVFRYAAYVAGGLPLLATVYGATVGRRRYRLITVEVPIRALPPNLDGLRIVHLSDLHIGDFMPRAAIRHAVDLANTAQADLAVLTGDLITHGQDPLEDCIAELSRLRAPLGVWGCHGNHERSAGVEARAQELFQRYGMHLLRQQCAELSWRGGTINLLGVDDQRERARAGEPSSMLRGIDALVRDDIPNILLSHNPDTFPRAAALGIELSLAGHTHGGQLRVALGDRQWSPASLITPFVAGLYRLPLGSEMPTTGAEVAPCPRKSAFLYVNRGLGTFGLPVRLGVPPEITVLILRAAE